MVPVSGHAFLTRLANILTGGSRRAVTLYVGRGYDHDRYRYRYRKQVNARGSLRSQGPDRDRLGATAGAGSAAPGRFPLGRAAGGWVRDLGGQHHACPNLWASCSVRGGCGQVMQVSAERS